MYLLLLRRLIIEYVLSTPVWAAKPGGGLAAVLRCLDRSLTAVGETPQVYAIRLNNRDFTRHSF